jgi:hypothetical protein
MTTAKNAKARKSSAPTPFAIDLNDLESIGGSRVRPFNTVLLREMAGCVWSSTKDQESQSELIQAIMAALKGFKPSDEIEGMLAAQAAALHFGAMECFRRSMSPEQPSDIASRLRRDGANLARTMVEMLDAFDRKRGKGPQVVRVERVVVQDGGRAFVGSVSPGITAPSPAIPIEAAPALPTMDLSQGDVPVLVDPRGRGEG